MSSFKKLIPTLNRVLIKRFEAKTTTASGIILNQAKDANAIGTVVATGPGNLTAEGKNIPVQVQVGDTVLLPDFGGSKVELNNEELFIYRDSEIIGILSE